MRLLEVDSMKVKQFMDNRVPKYAILSHTWEDEEVSFEEFSKVEGPDRQLAGYRKIEACCRGTKLRGHDYIWIDTCCIDKSSSAELSEAINSMFAWYQEAVECYVYLSDVDLREGSWPENFERSRWFTRGWTLQELLAPSHLYFYDKTWQKIGQKDELIPEITKATTISKWFIQTSGKGASVAQKMSWASRRETTRLEDQAYSLLGLFDVNMPLLYGEREKAFTRLQQELIRSTNDESLFAWISTKESETGMLAPSPANFAHATDIEEFRIYPFSRRDPYSLTNKGLQFELLYLKHSEAQTFEKSIISRYTADPSPQEKREPIGHGFVAPICCTTASNVNIILLYFEYLPWSEDLQRVRQNAIDTVDIDIIEKKSKKFKARTFYIQDSRTKVHNAPIYMPSDILVKYPYIKRKVP